MIEEKYFMCSIIEHLNENTEAKLTDVDYYNNTLNKFSMNKFKKEINSSVSKLKKM